MSYNMEKSLADFTKEEVVLLTTELVRELLFKIGHNSSTPPPSGGVVLSAQVTRDPAG
jgi:hypothetical protein